MPLNVECECGRKFRVKDELAGRKVKCPECKSALVIPSGGSTSPPTSSAKNTRPKSRQASAKVPPPQRRKTKSTKQPRKKSRGNSSAKPLIIVVAVLGAILVGGAIWKLVSTDDDSGTNVATAASEESSVVGDHNSQSSSAPLGESPSSQPASGHSPGTLQASAQNQPTPTQLTSSDPAKAAENTFRKFMLARISKDRSAIEQVTKPHSDLQVLVSGEPPSDILLQEASEYFNEEPVIHRKVGDRLPMSDTEFFTVTDYSVNNKRRMLSGFDEAITVELIGGVWKVDADLIIEMEAASQAINSQSNQKQVAQFERGTPGQGGGDSPKSVWASFLKALQSRDSDAALQLILPGEKRSDFVRRKDDLLQLPDARLKKMTELALVDIKTVGEFAVVVGAEKTQSKNSASAGLPTGRGPSIGRPPGTNGPGGGPPQMRGPSGAGRLPGRGPRGPGSTGGPTRQANPRISAKNSNPPASNAKARLFDFWCVNAGGRWYISPSMNKPPSDRIFSKDVRALEGWYAAMKERQ